MDIYCSRRKNKHFGALIKTANNVFRTQLTEILITLGIEATTYTAKRYKKLYSKKPQYVVYIPTKELERTFHQSLSMKLKRFSCL